MGKNCSSDLPRAISVADYILEDGGHTLIEAAEEFELSTTTIKRDINYLGCVAFYEYRPNAKELQEKYKKVKNILTQNKKNSVKKSQRATS